jgi:CRP-like cAMP-binding protein
MNEHQRPATDQPAADLTSLLAILHYFHPVSPAVEAFLKEHVRVGKVRKRTLLHREGQPCEQIYFILKGAIRGFTREGQKDITTWIVVENQLVSSIFSLNYRAPSIENIQALENCELLILRLDELETLYERFPEFNLTARKILQEYYADAERRAFIARLTRAENRYRYLLLHYPHLVNRIPLKYIASYLGMTLETLSRVRKKCSARLLPPGLTAGPFAASLQPDQLNAAPFAPSVQPDQPAASPIHPDPAAAKYSS